MRPDQHDMHACVILGMRIWEVNRDRKLDETLRYAAKTYLQNAIGHLLQPERDIHVKQGRAKNRASIRNDT